MAHFASPPAHKRPCKFFAEGTCNYGERCKYSHQFVAAAAGAPAAYGADYKATPAPAYNGNAAHTDPLWAYAKQRGMTDVGDRGKGCESLWDLLRALNAAQRAQNEMEESIQRRAVGLDLTKLELRRGAVVRVITLFEGFLYDLLSEATRALRANPVWYKAALFAVLKNGKPQEFPDKNEKLGGAVAAPAAAGAGDGKDKKSDRKDKARAVNSRLDNKQPKEQTLDKCAAFAVELLLEPAASVREKVQQYLLESIGQNELSPMLEKISGAFEAAKIGEASDIEAKFVSAATLTHLEMSFRTGVQQVAKVKFAQRATLTATLGFVYGIRCVFAHGNHRKTLAPSGALGVYRKHEQAKEIKFVGLPQDTESVTNWMSKLFTAMANEEEPIKNLSNFAVVNINQMLQHMAVYLTQAVSEVVATNYRIGIWGAAVPKDQDDTDFLGAAEAGMYT